jgi:hypothetical protein
MQGNNNRCTEVFATTYTTIHDTAGSRVRSWMSMQKTTNRCKEVFETTYTTIHDTTGSRVRSWVSMQETTNRCRDGFATTCTTIHDTAGSRVRSWVPMQGNNKSVQGGFCNYLHDYPRHCRKSCKVVGADAGKQLIGAGLSTQNYSQTCHNWADVVLNSKCDHTLP